jgi:hypothetical protein
MADNIASSRRIINENELEYNGKALELCARKQQI